MPRDWLISQLPLFGIGAAAGAAGGFSGFFKEMKVKDGNLTFSAERVFMDNKFTVEYQLMFNGDKLKGKAAAEIGGKKQEFDIEGKRLKKGT
jgi:hypothetical protein